MDDRVKKHAEILVDHCTDIEADDNVLIKAPAVANDLVVALHEQIGKRGARPMLSWMNIQASRAYARAMHVDDYRTKDHKLAAMKQTDVVIIVMGSVNASEMSDIDPEKTAASGRVTQPIRKERRETTRWVLTQYPTAADAQQAGMNTAAWTDFVYNAINMDWEAQRERQEQLVEILDPAEEIRIVSGTDTDLRLSVEGMRTGNDYAKHNLPGGETFTSPVPDSVNGEVLFDMPLTRSGREIHNVRLTFKDGEVVDHGAHQNEEVLSSLLNTDKGARRVGELGIGMNRGIDRFSHNMLFDEKMGDTIHLALGNAIEECVPADRTFNESAIHVDMIVDMSENSRIEVDNEVVQRDGIFCFEEGFK
ncbi:aminopeptidase (plasmid) [Halorussus salilacus]|uniref:aminopeptidase n=1 Tax=Halorussus salilacus TaxID=2953750 RepID=UPI00209DB907|nr:aminopeptidase [Halorussus salilacus]USZ70134.1 aminopeptidase [Halorussus salilacus]